MFVLYFTKKLLNPVVVRGLLERRSEEHLQSSNESMKIKTEQKNDKKKVTRTQSTYMPEKDRGRALDIESLV